LSAGIRLLAKGATAGEAVTAAMMLLEVNLLRRSWVYFSKYISRVSRS